MTTNIRPRLLPDRFPSYTMGWSALILILAAWLPAACTRFSTPEIQRDMAAEQMVVSLRQTNAGLTRFKCVGKISLSGPNRPAQSFRAAMAGQLADRLRIDMFAPFGGSAGTISSDGKHLFLVMHPSREYYRKRFGNGSLRRMIQMNVTVGDLLELLVGRIPMDAELSPRLMPDEDEAQTHLVFTDRWGKTRQRITVDASTHPVRSVWFDSNQNQTQTLTVTGRQMIGGFVLPKRIDLSTSSGERVSVILDRYEANARIDESLFVPAPLSS
ncbi:MAG: hypothetical protein HGJ94_19535 [Desulfosarcina sp.]|nr:hypothetical protein [Desulfosarcina sp.]MBC2741677.1 hypothetical protein [Desulfosarcina sp.]MBC2764591.1 hypothetical protein [Desulfosarcina sp.]